MGRHEQREQVFKLLYRVEFHAPEDMPEHTMFVITTDGMENASRRYNSEKVPRE